MAIPLELVTMIGSMGIGALFKLKHDKDRMYFSVLKENLKDVQDARDTINPGFQITRRWIALLSVIAVIVWPKVVSVFWPEIPVVVGYSELPHGLWGLFDDNEHIIWKTAQGLTITPLDSHLVAGIIGLYFGGKVGR